MIPKLPHLLASSVLRQDLGSYRQVLLPTQRQLAKVSRFGHHTFLTLCSDQNSMRTDAKHQEKVSFKSCIKKLQKNYVF